MRLHGFIESGNHFRDSPLIPILLATASMQFNQRFLRTGIGRRLAKRDPIQKSRDADPDILVDN